MKHKRLLWCVVVLLLSFAAPDFRAEPAPQTTAGAIRDLAGFTAHVLPANDDASTGAVPIGFTVNFFGQSFSTLFVNNNGNVTFDEPLAEFTPFDLTRSEERRVGKECRS